MAFGIPRKRSFLGCPFALLKDTSRFVIGVGIGLA